MGTISNWIDAIIVGLVAGLYGWFRDMGVKPYPSLRRSLPAFLLIGFFAGLFAIFGWHALQSPIGFIAVPAALIGLFLGWSARRKLSTKSEITE
jgi:hypothetical protein